jgi:GTP-binding protein EngB required for normal cell division
MGLETSMALTIICMTGPGNTGKSSALREFTAKHLKYEKAKGDILGIFPMPRRGYAVGVSGYGDNLEVVLEGGEFLTRYEKLRVMIVACRSEGDTLDAVRRFAKKARASLHLIPTERLAPRERNAAISANVKKIRRLMPG